MMNMNQQNNFIRNSRMQMGRNRGQYCPKPVKVECRPDYGTYPCDIPINSFTLGLDQNCYSFVAEITIPEGFILQREQYTTGISIDTTGLSIVGMTQKCQCCDSILCTTNRDGILLSGQVVCDVVLRGFKAACPLESTHCIAETSFNGWATVYVDKLLDISYVDSDPLNEKYFIIAEQGEEYITTFDGRSIYVDRDATEYNCLLKNPDVKKTVKIPYRLIIQGLGTGECNPMNSL